MIIKGLLVGILGNAAYDIIKKTVKEIIGDIDDKLVERIYASIELASQQFFDKYQNQFGVPSSSFLARQQNINLILKYIYYESDINLLNDLCRHGFDGVPDVTEEAILFFLDTLEKTMKEDFELNKILTEKKHIKESKEVAEKVIKMLSQFTQQNNLGAETKDKKHKWVMVNETGKESPYKEGERYTQRFPNGVEITIMIKKDLIYVDFTAKNGEKSYYELDFDGNVSRMKPPYDLTEYTVEIPPDEIVDKKIIHLQNGFQREIYILKWDRQADLLFDKDMKLRAFELRGGWHVSHHNKRIRAANI